MGKQSENGKTVATLPKGIFPTLLKMFLDDYKCNMKKNLKSSFKKVGTYSIKKEEVLKLLPSYNVSVNLELVKKHLSKLD